MDGISERDRKEKDAGTFRRGRFSHETPKSKLGRRIRRGYSRDQDERARLEETEVSSLLVIPKTPGAELSIPVSRKEMGEEEEDDDDDDDDERVIRISY